jgi:hypothetical protein
MMRGRWRGLGVLGLLVVLGAASCGRYGPPVRAEQYREKDRTKQEAQQQREKETTPESRNEPLPAAP